MDQEIDRMFGELHGPMMKLVLLLVDLDPLLGSPEGNMLNGLADAIHAYETVKYPLEEEIVNGL